MPRSTLWNLEPHTLGKHKVLRGYLHAWFPIMGKWNGRILFIDGFAGPGEYASGEVGSPIIALDVLQEHHAKKTMRAEIGFIFVEKDKRRVDHLRSLLDSRRKSLPRNSWIVIHHAPFDEALSEVLDQVDAQLTNLAPSFVMIDPFGVSETPMSVIRRILQNPKSEVYISFQYEAINRFKDTPEFEHHLDELFGVGEWRDGIDIPDAKARKDFLYGLYERQLREAGAKHVLHFELYEGARLIYAIFFATEHELGCDRMKQAIWKVAPWGDYCFRPARGGQLTLGLEAPDLEPLRFQLMQEFAGKGWVSIQEVMSFVQSDRTPYHSGHLRRGALAHLEEQGKIRVDETSRRRMKTYPDGTLLRFLP